MEPQGSVRKLRAPIVAVLVAVGAALANGVWVFLDRTTPYYDQAHYLYLTVIYNDTVAGPGLGHLFQTATEFDPFRGPLYQLALMPWLALFGDVPRSALLYNALLSVIFYVAAGEVAHQIFGNGRARLYAIALVALTPLLLGLQHEVLVDFQLVTLATLTVLFLLRSDGFSRRTPSVLAGITIGLGILTKVTFPAFVIGPAMVVMGLLVVRWIRPAREEAATGETRVGVRTACVNAALLVGIGLAIALPWYLPNRAATVDYVQSTTGGALAEGAGPKHPLTLHNMTVFVVGVADSHVGMVLTLASLLVLLLLAGRLWSGWAGWRENGVVWKSALMLTWAGIPFLALLAGHNQDGRLMAPAVAAFSILVAGGLSLVEPVSLQGALVTVVVLTMGFQALNRTVPIAPSWLPDQATVTVRGHVLSLPIGSTTGLGYERLPQRDRIGPIFDYVEARARVDGRTRPTALCLLASHPVVNGNTLTYLIASREDPFTVRDITIGPDGVAGLAAVLATCDIAFYIKPPPGLRSRPDRLSIVNVPYAASYMTPELFAIFDGASRSFPIGAAPVSTDERAQVPPLDTTRVRVLTQSRRRSG